MSSEFLQKVKLDFDYSSVDGFVSSVLAGIDKLEAKAEAGDAISHATPSVGGFVPGTHRGASQSSWEGHAYKRAQQYDQDVDQGRGRPTRLNPSGHKTPVFTPSGRIIQSDENLRRLEKVVQSGAKDWVDAQTQYRRSNASGSAALAGSPEYVRANTQASLSAAHLFLQQNKDRLNVLGPKDGAGYQMLGENEAVKRLMSVMTQLAAASGVDVETEAELVKVKQQLKIAIQDEVARLEAGPKENAAYRAQTRRNPLTEAHTRLAAQQTDRLRNAEVERLRREQGLPGLGWGRGGTRWQQFQGAIHHTSGGAGGRVNTDFQSLGQFMGGHVAKTLSYAIPGLAIGAGIEELRQSVQEAEKAQEALAQVKAEFSALGQSDQFGGFANSIKAISDNTGLAVDEVADLGLAMKGVFGSTQQATIALNGVAQAAVAMDLSAKEAQTDLTAIDQAFTEFQGKGGGAITGISNEALHLQDLFGVKASSIVQGTADLAPNANQLGLTSNQTMSLIASTAQRSGEDPSTIASGLAKIMPGFTQNTSQLMQYYEEVPGLQKSRGAFLGDLNNGKTGDAFLQMITDFKNIPASMQVAITQALGGNASSQAMLLQASQGASKANAASKTTASPDRTAEEFKKQMGTLKGELERLRAAATNFGVAIVDSGAGKALGEIVNAAGDVLKVMTNLNSITDGYAGKMMALTGAILAVKAAWSGLRTVPAIVNGLTKAVTANTLATDVNAVAQKTDTESVDANALAQKTDAAAQDLSTGSASKNALARLMGAGAGAARSVGTALTADVTASSLTSTGTLMGAGVAGVAGYGIGSYVNHILSGHSKTDNVLKHTVLAPLDFFKGEVSTFGHLVNRPDQGLKHVKSQSSLGPKGWLGSSLGDIETAASPQMSAQMQFDAKHSGNHADYEQLLQDYTKVASTAAGKSALASDPALKVKAAAQKKAAAIAKAKTEAQIELTDWAGIQSAYQAGTASYQQLIATAQQTVSNAQQAYKTMPSDATYEALQTAIQARNQAFDQATLANQQMAQAFVQQNNPQAIQNYINSVVKAMPNTKTSAGQLQEVNTVVQQYQAKLQAEIANATSQAQALEIGLKGLQIPPAELAEINKILKKYGMAPISGKIVAPQQTLSQKFSSAQEQSSATEAQAAAGADEDPQKVLKAQLAQAQSDVKSYLSSGGKKSDPQYKTLQANVKNIQNQMNDATAAVIESQAGLLAATLANDPVGAAQASLQQAKAALADAHGAAAKNQAKAQIVQAQLQIQQAIQAQSDAMSAQVQATMTAQGNPVGAAFAKYQQDLVDIQQRISTDKSLGMSSAQIHQDTQLQNMIAQATNDKTGALQTQFSTLQTTTQEQLYLGQITATQAIAELQAGMAQAKGNQQLVLQYQQAIRQIQDQAGSNLNFDLPSNLLVNPTLYQAARVNALGGSSYQDQRQVSVVVNVNNSSQNPGAVGQILTAIGGPGTAGSVGPLISSPVAG